MDASTFAADEMKVLALVARFTLNRATRPANSASSLSAAVRPGSPALPGSNGEILAHCASVNRSERIE